MNYEKILVRIKKLLDLSKNAGSDEEAAVAAERAAELMAEYEIAEAELSLLDDTRPKEVIVDQPFERGCDRRRKVTWQDTITHAVARSYGCKSYWSGAHVYLYGRESSVQAVRYTAQYLHREVKDLATKAWALAMAADFAEELDARSWKNSFRVGCSAMVSQRLHAKANEEKRERRERARQAVGDKVKPDALAVVEGDREEVASAYAKRSKGFGVHHGGGMGSSGSGYAAGRQVGRDVRLGGGRAALGKGQGQIR